MGRWVKVSGYERKGETQKKEQFLKQAEKLVLKLQAQELIEEKPLSAEDQLTMAAYGQILQSYGRLRYLTARELETFDYYMGKRFLRRIFFKGSEKEFKKLTAHDEAQNYLDSLPKRVIKPE